MDATWHAKLQNLVDSQLRVTQHLQAVSMNKTSMQVTPMIVTISTQTTTPPIIVVTSKTRTPPPVTVLKTIVKKKKDIVRPYAVPPRRRGRPVMDRILE